MRAVYVFVVALLTSTTSSLSQTVNRANPPTQSDTLSWGELLNASFNSQLPKNHAEAPLKISMVENQKSISDLIALRARTQADGVEYGQDIYGFTSNGNVRFRSTPIYSGLDNSISADVYGKDYFQQVKELYPNAATALKIHTHPGANTFSLPDIMITLKNRQPSIVVTTTDIYLAVPSSTYQMSALEYILLASGDHPHEDKFVCETMAVFGETRVERSNHFRLKLFSQIGMALYKFDSEAKVFFKLPSAPEMNIRSFVDNFRTQTIDAVRMTVADQGVEAVRRDVSSAKFATNVKNRIGLPFAKYAPSALKMANMMRLGGRREPKLYTSPIDPASEWVVVHSVGRDSCEAGAASIRFGKGDEQPSSIYEIRSNSGNITLKQVK